MAKLQFGVTEKASLQLHHADGLQFLAEAQPQSYDVIILDASDSCGHREEQRQLESPPASFLSPTFLSGALKRSLHPDGILALSAHGSASGLVSVANSLKSCFGAVWVLITADVGFIYFATNSSNTEVVTQKSLCSMSRKCLELSPLIVDFSLFDESQGMAPQAMPIPAFCGWHQGEAFSKLIITHAEQVDEFLRQQKENALWQVGREEKR